MEISYINKYKSQSFSLSVTLYGCLALYFSLHTFKHSHSRYVSNYITNGALTAPYRCKRQATNFKPTTFTRNFSNKQRINKHHKNRFNIYKLLCIVLLFSNNNNNNDDGDGDNSNNNIDVDDGFSGTNSDTVYLSITAWLCGVHIFI